jgi:lipid A oxidase
MQHISLSAAATPVQRRRVRVPADRAVEIAGSLFALVMLAAAAGSFMAEQSSVDQEAAAARSAASPGALEAARAETMVAGYLGAPYTYPSDLHFENPAEKTDFTLKQVGWDAKPFKHPIYYGVRVARWSPGNRSGFMVDFTHSKTITRPDEEVEIKGLINGAPAPAKAKIGALFKHLEFSHGHNMLTFNGLFRLAALTPRISPYVGVGVGVSLPHTEVAMIGEPKRTYEYQFTGPAAQALAGLELRLGQTSVFFEYKFTFADYRAPLSRLEGDLGVTDVWRQFKLWWSGVAPPGGHLSTRLSSHNVIGGVGYRF